MCKIFYKVRYEHSMENSSTLTRKTSEFDLKGNVNVIYISSYPTRPRRITVNYTFKALFPLKGKGHNDNDDTIHVIDSFMYGVLKEY